MNMTIWWLSLALMLLCEGALIGIAPAAWRRTIKQISALPAPTIAPVADPVIPAEAAAHEQTEDKETVLP